MLHPLRNAVTMATGIRNIYVNGDFSVEQLETCSDKFFCIRLQINLLSDRETSEHMT